MGGLFLITVTGRLWIDSVIAIGFGLFIIYTGYNILRVSLAGIMDEADMVLLEKMVDLLKRNRPDNWVDLHNLRVIKYGNVLHVDCHLTMPWYLNLNQSHEEIDRLGGLIRAEFGETLEMFVHSDGCGYFQCHICKKKDCPVRQHAFEKVIDWNLDNALQNEKHGHSHLAEQADKS
jgi:divalent metal cation (Fe/Co/Zn/Cd) transporter